MSPRIGTSSVSPPPREKPLSIKAESDSIGYEVDPLLRVTDDTGKMLAEAESSRRGGEPVLNFTPPADGPYRLEIADLHRRGGLRYAYRITLAPATFGRIISKRYHYPSTLSALLLRGVTL